MPCPRISTRWSRFSAARALSGGMSSKCFASAMTGSGRRGGGGVRRPDGAGRLQPVGKVGQIHAVQANLRYPASVEAAMRDSHAAINLVGILAEGGAQTFDAVPGLGRGGGPKA